MERRKENAEFVNTLLEVLDDPRWKETLTYGDYLASLTVVITLVVRHLEVTRPQDAEEIRKTAIEYISLSVLDPTFMPR